MKGLIIKPLGNLTNSWEVWQNFWDKWQMFFLLILSFQLKIFFQEMIKNINSSDFDFIYELYMHPATNPYLLYEPMSEGAFKPIFEDLLAQNIIFIYSENGQNIGMFKLIPLQHRSSHINYLGGLAIHPDFAGMGFGSKMLQEIIILGKERGIKRLELSTGTFNKKAIKLYEKHGFVFEGILRNYVYIEVKGGLVDEQMMSYLYE